VRAAGSINVPGRDRPYVNAVGTTEKDRDLAAPNSRQPQRPLDDTHVDSAMLPRGGCSIYLQMGFIFIPLFFFCFIFMGGGGRGMFSKLDMSAPQLFPCRSTRRYP